MIVGAQDIEGGAGGDDQAPVAVTDVAAVPVERAGYRDISAAANPANRAPEVGDVVDLQVLDRLRGGGGQRAAANLHETGAGQCVSRLEIRGSARELQDLTGRSIEVPGARAAVVDIESSLLDVDGAVVVEWKVKLRALRGETDAFGVDAGRGVGESGTGAVVLVACDRSGR